MYKCPEDYILERIDNCTVNGVTMKQYTTDECLNCESHDKCTTQHKRIIKDRFDPIVDSYKCLYNSKFGQEAFSGRAPNSENSYGTLKESRNFRGIKRRGVIKANLEMTLTVITHNLKKIHKHISLKVLKKILNEIREKKKTMKVTIDIMDNWTNKYVKKGDKIIDLKI